MALCVVGGLGQQAWASVSPSVLCPLSPHTKLTLDSGLSHLEGRPWKYSNSCDKHTPLAAGMPVPDVST